MCRKLIFLISLVLVIGLAGSASAATKYFEDGDANNHLWSNRWNWADGNVPVAADNARFQINGSRCIIDANNTTAVCVYTRFPSSQTTDYIYLDIEGGTLTTTSHVTVGYSNDAWDITKDVYMTVKSGTVNCGGDLIVSYWGEGSLIVEGGTINVTGVVEVAKGTNADKGFTVHIQLDGGQINCTDFTHVRTYVPVSMDIGAGKMTITGDKVAKMFMDHDVESVFTDATGVGSGTAPQIIRTLRSFGVSVGRGTVNGVKVANAPTLTADMGDGDKLGEFAQLRDQLWWSVRQWLKTDSSAMLPPDQMLIEELLAVTYEVVNGKVKVMSREKISKSLKRSPDRASSLCLTFAPKRSKVEIAFV